jgi:hypothetical protein
MFEKLEIWKRCDQDVAVRFQCLRRTKDNAYAVQNADFIRLESYELGLRASDIMFIELFLDDDPESRCQWFPSLEEAISAHEADFSNRESSAGPQKYELKRP